MANRTWSMFFLITAALLFSPGQANAGNVYKWVDSEGNLHFSEKAPEGVQATRVTTDTRKVGTVTPTTMDVETHKKESQARKENEELVQEKRRNRKEKKALRVQKCETARARIAKLEPSPRVNVMGKDGEVRRLNDDERLKWLESSKNEEKENCDK